MTEEVIKRELIDGDEAKSASAFLKKMLKRMNAKRNGSDDDQDDSDLSGASAALPETLSAAAAGVPASKPQG